MKEWLTAGEIAAQELPYMPKSKRGVNLMADRDGWNNDFAHTRQRTGREGGGGMEYHIDVLPMLAKMAYRQRYLVVDLPVANDTPALVAQSDRDLSAAARTQRDARVAIVRAFERLTNGMEQISQAARLQIFADRYEMGHVKIDDWVKDTVPTFSRRSLLRWLSLVRKGETEALAVDQAKSRAGTGVLDRANNGKVRTFILAIIAQNPHLSAAQVRTMCRSEFGDAIEIEKTGEIRTTPMPPVRTFQHALKGYKTTFKVELTKLRNPDLYRSTMRASGTGALRHIKEPNTLWQIDASPVDALCVDGRHSVYACIDIATRRTMFFVSRTPRAAAVAILLRKAILAWGVPEKIKTDNGSDFVANDTKRLLDFLDIEMELSDAYSPQQKGHVERVIKTFQHDFAALLPGYVGHSVEDRKEIESRKSFATRLGQTEDETFGVSLTGTDLQKLCDRWADVYYQHKPHAGLNGKTPFQTAMSSGSVTRTVEPEALDLLLMPVPGSDGLRTVTKLGIRIDHHHYLTFNILPGTRVFVRQDPHDVGRVLAFEEDGGTYLGEAICAELAGLHPATLARAAREMQSELIESTNAQIKRDMRQLAKGRSLIERALEVAQRDMPNVVSLPRKTEDHSTRQISAALSVMDKAGSRLQPKVTDARTLEEQQRLISEMAADEEAALNNRVEALVQHREAEIEADRTAHLPTTVTALPESPKQRYTRALKVQEAVDLGTADPRDAVWLGRYQTTSEFKTQREMHEDFGDEYLGL